MLSSATYLNETWQNLLKALEIIRKKSLLIKICKSWLAYEQQLYQVPIDLAEQKITSFVLTSPNTKYRVFCTSERLLLFDWLFVISRKKSWKKKNDTTQILANLAFHVTCWAEWRRCIDHKDFCHCVPLSAQKIKTSARCKVHLKQQVSSKFYLELINLAILKLLLYRNSMCQA